MNQMTTSSERKKMADFGTYRYSTHCGSEKLREKVKILFTRSLWRPAIRSGRQTENTRCRLQTRIPLMRQR